MRCLLSLVLLFAFNVTTSAQKVKRKGVEPIKIFPAVAKTPTYTLSQIQGKWQETNRTTMETPVEFKDSLQIHIKNDTAIIREGLFFTMHGEAFIDVPNVAKLAGEFYSIKKLEDDRMDLGDGKFVRHMQRIPEFWFESFGKLVVKPESFETPVTPDLTKIIGNWSVYRRQALPGTSHDYALIRYLNIQKANPDSSYTGEVGFYIGDSGTSGPCSILFRNNEMQIISDKSTWVLSIYKNDGEEFVFGNPAEVLYYSKKR